MRRAKACVRVTVMPSWRANGVTEVVTTHNRVRLDIFHRLEQGAHLKRARDRTALLIMDMEAHHELAHVVHSTGYGVLSADIQRLPQSTDLLHERHE